MKALPVDFVEVFSRTQFRFQGYGFVDFDTHAAAEAAVKVSWSAFSFS